MRNEEIINGDYKWSDEDEEKTLSIEEHTRSDTIKDDNKMQEISDDNNKKEERSTYEYEQQMNKLEQQIQKLEESIEKISKNLKTYTDSIRTYTENISTYTNSIKSYTDAKSWREVSQGVLYVRKYSDYYDVSRTITTAAPTDPDDFDSPVYQRERIFESLERRAEVLMVTNEGPGTLFVIISHDGTTGFSKEVPIFNGETKIYYNVYELRVRSPTAGLSYRVTEYKINAAGSSGLTPIELAVLHDTPLPAANSDILASDISITGTEGSSSPVTFRIQISISIAGVFSAAITRSGNTQVVDFNPVAGPALVPDGIYIFDLMVHDGDSVNFRYSATGGTIRILRVQEIDRAIS